MERNVSSVELCSVLAHPLAVVRAIANSRELGAKIQEILTQNAVYALLKRQQITEFGKNVILYWDEDEKCLLQSEQGLAIEVGVQMFRPFESEDPVVRSATPGGMTAKAKHTGPYHLLGRAHGAIRNWCRHNNRRIAGPNWEIYGHWNDDPSKLETDVHYLLK
jgi:effector-binding domain-containing protein